MGASKARKVEAVLANLRLDGEDIIRVSTGEVVPSWTINEGYLMIHVGEIDGWQYQDLVHRVKWCLLFGELPVRLDHRDRDPANNLKANLRMVSASVNAHNRRRFGKSGLPRGVYFKSQKFLNKPYEARITSRGKQLYLGMYATPEEASVVVEAKLNEIYGDNYCPPEI